MSETKFHDSSLDGNEIIVTAIDNFYADGCKENLARVLDAIRIRMHADGHLLFPVLISDDGVFSLRAIQTNDGKLWQAAFTSQEELEKGAPSQVLSNFIDTTLKACINTDAAGFVINPWSQSFFLTKELIGLMFQADGDGE